jgi:TonB family protein
MRKFPVRLITMLKPVLFSAIFFTASSAFCFALPALSEQPAAKVDSLEQYKISMQKRIGRCYFPPKCSAPGTSKVTITVAKTGAILASKLSKSSGCPLYDRSALDAIERVGSLSPLPEGMSQFSAELSFDYKLFSPGSAVTIKKSTSVREDDIPKTHSAEFLTAPRTIQQVCGALRANDFAAAQMNIAGLRTDGTDMLVRLIFKQVEIAGDGGHAQNIDDIIYKVAYFSADETSAIQRLTAPLITTLESKKTGAIKNDTVFLGQLADLFAKLEELTHQNKAQ